MHTACPTGDVFGSGLCDCGPDLRRALARIAAEGRGLVVYLQKELRSPSDILRCTHTPEEGRGETDDLREFGIGAQILRDLGATRLRLLTDRPRRIVGLEGFGIEVVETVPLSRPRQAKRAS
jgi:3,4-dihydroxy 2-butanone 4-phosphate synthase/GTP cyclohydrolase II